MHEYWAVNLLCTFRGDVFLKFPTVCPHVKENEKKM